MNEYTEKINAYVGKRLQFKRKKIGLSLTEIADHLGVSFQHIQKYESGQSKISSARLSEIADLLEVDFDYFFIGFKTVKKRNQFVHGLILQQDQPCPLNVLLVEDDEASVLLTQKAFESSSVGINLHTITDGTHVLDFLRGTTASTSAPFSRPDIIILDLNLPKIDGITLLRNIKYDTNLSDIPVIILSNSTNPNDMIACYQAQAAGFMHKSFDFEVFEKNIEILTTYWGQTVVLRNHQRETVYKASENKT